jgi:hypothetical protein
MVMKRRKNRLVINSKASKQVSLRRGGGVRVFSSLLEIWASLSSRLKLLIGAFGFSSASIFAFFTPMLEPVREWVIREIWVERAEVSASCSPCSLTAGQSTSISIDVRPSSVPGVSKGLIKLDFDRQALVFASDSPKSLEFQATKSPVHIDKAFILYGSETLRIPTKAKFRVVLETQSLRQSSSWVEVDISPKSALGARPFIDPNGRRGVNLSGEWRIEIGGALGGMKISQDEHDDVAGSYWLNSPVGKVSGQINGYKDGTSFKVFFIKQNSRSNWRVDANFKINESDKGYIEMKGCAFGIQPDDTVLSDTIVEDAKICENRNYSGWRGVSASTFYASAQLRQ